MSTSRRIVCLANSRKLGGRCVAGKEISDNAFGNWIRPVSARESEDVSEYERRYEGGGDPRLLDIMDVPLRKPKPNAHQCENWLLDSRFHWRKDGCLPWCDLERLVDPVQPLWHNGHHTSNGTNDMIPAAMLGALDDSLRLVRVDGLSLSVSNPGAAFGDHKRRVQGWFRHAGVEYHLWVTDPGCERAYLAKPDATYEINEPLFLTLSLGEPFGGDCHKLIAAVIPRSGGIAP